MCNKLKSGCRFEGNTLLSSKAATDVIQTYVISFRAVAEIRLTRVINARVLTDVGTNTCNKL